MKELLRQYAEKYNDLAYFQEDPSAFGRRFNELLKQGRSSKADVEIASLLSAHLAWGRRSMIVRDCTRMFDQMDWHPYDYVMRGNYRRDPVSLHRTVKWSELAAICERMRNLYEESPSIEGLSPDQIRTRVYGQKSNLKAANKKIHMFRRWMVRRDGIVDFGIWRETDPTELIIPLDTHVHTQALEMKITERRASDFTTAQQITDYFRDIFPDDPCKGDFALFGYGVSKNRK